MPPPFHPDPYGKGKGEGGKGESDKGDGGKGKGGKGRGRRKRGDDKTRQDLSQVYNHEGPPTTMMIRNIPCKCNKQDVLKDIDEKGFQGQYDFFYLPFDRKNKSNLGYAFINFKAPESAESFQGRLDGHRFGRGSDGNNRSHKVCTISPATVQGLEANLSHFKSKAVLKSKQFAKQKPDFFVEGGREAMGLPGSDDDADDDGET